MKNLLFLPLILLLVLSSCKKEESVELPTKLVLEVKKQNKSSSGSITLERTNAMIHIWNAENRDFDVDASPDIIYGSAYDRLSGTSHTMNYGAIGHIMKEKIKPGRYFVHLLLPKSSSKGSLAYSYTYFEIKKGETLNLTKIFSHDIGSGMYEEWAKNQ